MSDPMETREFLDFWNLHLEGWSYSADVEPLVKEAALQAWHASRAPVPGPAPDPQMEKHRALMEGMTKAGLLPSGPAPSHDLRAALDRLEQWFRFFRPGLANGDMHQTCRDDVQTIRLALLPQGGPAPLEEQPGAFDATPYLAPPTLDPVYPGVGVEPSPEAAPLPTCKACGNVMVQDYCENDRCTERGIDVPPKTEGRSAPGEPGFRAWWEDHLRKNSYRADVDESLIRDAAEDAWEVATSQAEDILHAWAKRRGYVVGPQGLQALRREAPLSEAKGPSSPPLLVPPSDPLREWDAWILKGGRDIASNPELTKAMEGKIRVREVRE